MINIGDKIKLSDNSVVEVLEYVRAAYVRKRNSLDNKVFIYKISHKGTIKYASEDGLESRFSNIVDTVIANTGYRGNIKISNYYKREYDIWKNMIYRCYYPSSNLYRYYGAQGVIVFDQWLCFEIFLYDFINLRGYDKFKSDEMHRYDLDIERKQSKIPMNQRIYRDDTVAIKPFSQTDVFTAWQDYKGAEITNKDKTAQEKIQANIELMQSVPIDEAILKAQQPSGPDYNKYKPRGDGSYPPQAYAYVIEHPPQLNPVMNENYPPPGTVRTFNGVINLHRPPFAPNTTAGKAGFGKKVMCKIVDEKEYCINLNSEGTKK